MSVDDDLRLAWQAHREGRLGRRDALLTLAVAGAEPEGAAWVGSVRDFLVATHPGHLYAGFYQLDEALADRRVIAALGRLRLSFPPKRVRNLVRRDEVARGPFTGRKAPQVFLLDDLLAPSRAKPKGAPKLIATPKKPAKAAQAPTADPAPTPDSGGPILAFYLDVLLSIAVLCAIVLQDSQDGKRAA